MESISEKIRHSLSTGLGAEPFPPGDAWGNFVAIEHENEHRGFGKEVEKLMSVLAPLNVGITYVWKGDQMTRATGDGGIDIVAHLDKPIVGGRYLIQCKRFTGPVGAPIVREFYGAVQADRRAVKGILITT